MIFNLIGIILSIGLAAYTAGESIKPKITLFEYLFYSLVAIFSLGCVLIICVGMSS